MDIPFFLIEVFNNPQLAMRGNIAAVLHLEEKMSDAKMQEIAEDLAQPATSFMIRSQNHPKIFDIRWFAPSSEIGLCGHGSLAAIASLQNETVLDEKVVFNFPAGQIQSELISPSQASIVIEAVKITKRNYDFGELEAALGQKVLEHYFTENKDIVILENEKAIRSLKPDFESLRKLKSFGYSISSFGESVDYVSRTIIPFVPILEDQATGSSQATLAPYWAKQLNKNRLKTHQLSERGGEFHIDIKENHVKLKGNYKILSQGLLSI